MAGSYYEVEVRPNAQGWSAALERQIGAPMRALSEDIKRNLGSAAQDAFDGIGARLRASLDPAVRAATDNLRNALQRAVRDGLNGTGSNPGNQGRQSGSRYGDAFGREVQSRLRRAFENLPEVRIDANSRDVDRQVAEIRSKIGATLQQLDFGVDPASVQRQVEQLRAQLETLARGTDVRVRINATAALAELTAFQAALRRTGSQSGDEFSDAFARVARAKLSAAASSLPKLKIDANSSDLDRTLADIRRKLEATDRGIQLGVRTDLVDAQVDALRARLERLSRESPDIRVRVNTGTALAELEALKRAAADFEGRGGRIKRAFSGELFGDAFRSLATSARTALPALDGLYNKLSSVGDSLKGVSDQATAGVKSNPILGLASSNVLVTAIAAALTTVGPLAAAATGGVLGLAGAAGAAVLAFRGLQTQMSLNVGYGKQLQTEFSGVMGVVDALGEAVADAMGPGLVSALARVRESLPSFSGLFKGIGSQLGDVAGSLTTALVDVFRNSSPVILQVVGYIKQGAERLAQWTGGEGFKQFLAYASRELPIVGSAVLSIGEALVKAFVAFAPVGEVVLRVLGGIANIASGVFDTIGSVIDFFSGDASPKANGPAAQFAAMAAQLQNLGAVTTTVTNTSTGLAAVFGVTDGAFKAATDSAASTAAQLADTTLQMRLQNDAAGLLKASLDALSGKNLGVAQTLTSFQQGLLGIDDTFTKAAFSSTAFTDTAVAQRSELQQLVTAAQAHAEAVGQQTNSTKAATDALAADYAQILQNTGATGANRDAIAAYIQQVGAIPPVALTKVETEVAAGIASIARFQAAYAGVLDKTVFVNADTDSAAASINRFISTPRTAYVQVQTLGPNGGSGGKAVFAQGGILDSVPAYAMGGVVEGFQAKMRAAIPSFAGGSENHIPQIVMPGKYARIWAEPETKGEAYIPFNPDRRPRAEAILGEVAKRFGGAFTKTNPEDIIQYAVAHLSASYTPPRVPPAPPQLASGTTTTAAGLGLLGLAVTIDAGSVGTLTGHISGVADSRIEASDRHKALIAGPKASPAY